MHKLGILGAIGLFLVSTADAAVLAKVNGRTITDSDLQAVLTAFNESQKDSILKDQNSKKQIVENLIDQELLVEQAEKAKLEQSKEYQEALSAFRKQFLSNLWIQKKLAPQMTDSAAKRYYSANKNIFSSEQVRAYHILSESLDEAKKVLGVVKQKDVDFQRIAEKQSKDPTVEQNRGDLGYFTRDRFTPEFTNPVFSAKEGEIIGPIQTAYGYHVIKIVDKKPGDVLNYDEVELKVKTLLRQELINEHVSSLKKSAKIQTF